jgi:hypothetical protein
MEHAQFAVSCVTASLVLLSLLATRTRALAGEKDAAATMELLRSLAGTWVTEKPGPHGPGELVFRVTANGSTVVETMFPGQPHEMINTYHMDGDRVLVTHYCAQGVQPRMKLVSSEGDTLKFDFLDCTNLKPGESHMGGLELIISGDKLVEKWATLDKDGKPSQHMTFELKRKA